VQLPNDPVDEAIIERVRTIIARQPTCTLAHLADVLAVPVDQLQQLSPGQDGLVEVTVLIDIVVALVRECAVDPQWLLTGRYDGAVHRQALLLGENRTGNSSRELHDFIHKQYHQIRSPARDFHWSGLFGH
jgi:hypothetical protein